MTASDAERFVLQETLYTSSNPTRRWLHCSRRDWILATLRSRLDERVERALEVGPGSGLYLPPLAKLADEVVGSDVDDAYLSRIGHLVGRSSGITLVRDDITRSSFPDDHFDCVLCTEVIEHIDDSQTALAEMRRILRPGGILVLSTPQRYSPLEVCAKFAFMPGIVQLVRRVYREPIIETGHINLLTRRELLSQLSHAGFVVVEEHTTGMYLPVIAELGGERARRFLQRLEGRLRDTRFAGLLWTQYAVATA